MIMALFCAVVFAVPAKRGVFKTIKLADGTEVRAELRGDEHVNYWQAADGRNFILSENLDCYVEADVQQMCANYLAEKEQMEVLVKGPNRAAGQQPSNPIVGDRKGIIVLVNFTDVKFEEGHDAEYFDKVANELNFTNTDGYVGSVRDYYLAQSGGQLDYTFDIVGPVDLAHNQAYYGGHSYNQNDKNIKAFVKEATDLIKEQINFADYDNDGDGQVDNIFFLYAGKEEADGGGDDCIWPHMYYYPSLGLSYSQNGVSLNVYACASELQYNGRMGGIGAICHEFSHCLGLPDLYDTAGGDNYGMDYWSLMHAGCYLGSSFRPCGYTAYEKDYCGWLPIEELTEDVTITDLAGISDGGHGYKVYNDRTNNEYYIFEARTKTGWDVELPSEGLMVTHVDYSSNAWYSNTVNNTNGHQRCFIVAADNSYGTTWSDVAGDVFPTKNNDLFSDTSTPAATWYNRNNAGNKNFGYSIYDIKKGVHAVSFSFMRGTYVYDNNAPEGSVFYESFARCEGTGGNDGVFSSSMKPDDFVPDNDGWSCMTKKGCNGCALFGSNALSRETVTMPTITLDPSKTYTMTFLAAPYNTDATSWTMKVESGNATLLDDSVDDSAEAATVTFNMEKGKWTPISFTIKGDGEQVFTFKGASNSAKRILLDEILIMPADLSGIESVEIKASENGVLYNLAGQKVDNDYRGIVISNGRKFIKR